MSGLETTEHIVGISGLETTEHIAGMFKMTWNKIYFPYLLTGTFCDMIEVTW